MTLIDKNGSPADDRWTYWRQGQDLPDLEHCVVRLDQWDIYTAQSGANAKGVWMRGSDDAARVLAMLEQLSVIVIEFPKSRDGRGFTLARLFRERHHFAGDIRAAGPLLPDQFAVLLQCGFSSLFALPTVPLSRWRDAAGVLASNQSKPRTLLDRLSRGAQV